MGEKSEQTLRWPIKGLNERLALHDQLPLTTPDARNVRPDGNLEGRTRGGSRPPLVPAYSQGVGGAAEGVVSGTPSYSASTGLTTITSTTVTGTLASITSPSVDNLTRLDSAGTEFVLPVLDPASPAASVGSMFHFDTGGNEYQIAEVLNTAIIKVWGDATDESGTDTFVLAPFNSEMVGNNITFWSGSTQGNSYNISSVTSQSVIVVVGNASGESGNFQVGSAQIRLLAQVNVGVTDGSQLWTDNFSSIGTGGTFPPNGPWGEFGAGYSESLGPLRIQNALGVNYVWAPTQGSQADMLRVPLDPILDPTTDYQITLTVNPTGLTEDHYVRIYAAMRGTDPDPTENGVIVTLWQDDSLSRYRVDIDQRRTGTGDTNEGSFFPELTALEEFEFKAVFDGDRKKVEVYIDGNLVATTTFTTKTNIGTQIGIGLEDRISGSNFKWFIRKIEVQYTALPVVANTIRKQLVVSANGKLWRTTKEDTLTRLSTLTTLASDRLLMAASHNQLLYIADHGTALATGTALQGEVVAANKLGGAIVSDWSAIGVVSSDLDHVVVITDESGATPPVPGVYKITTVASDGLTLTQRSGSTDFASGGVTSGRCAFRVERAVKVFDPAANTLSIAEETDGALGLGFPQGSKLIAMHQNRLYLGAPENRPHGWFASRKASKGTETVQQWELRQDSGDPSFAVSHLTGDVGDMGGDLTAMFSANKDYLLFSTRTTIWWMKGDPATGSFDNVSRQIGIVDKNAWCILPSGLVIILSEDGLYAIPSSIEASPVSLSRKFMPEQLININVEQNDVLLEYDVKFAGVHIYLTPKFTDFIGSAAAATAHWWFDIDLESFWPVTLPTDLEPTSIISYAAPISDRGGALLGCRDGFVRQYKKTLLNLDGTFPRVSIDSHIVFGPFPLGSDPFHEGIVTELFAALAVDSGNVAWKLFVADTAEECKNLAIDDTVTADATGSWTGTDVLTYKSRPRTRGGFFCLRLNNDNQFRGWAIETIQVATKKVGKLRK